eukprot:1037036-Pyramimonas_sp.AAC.1
MSASVVFSATTCAVGNQPQRKFTTSCACAATAPRCVKTHPGSDVATTRSLDDQLSLYGKTCEMCAFMSFHSSTNHELH